MTSNILGVGTSVVDDNVRYRPDASVVQLPGQALQLLLGPVTGGEIIQLSRQVSLQ